ncbi:MAG: hypothetical protein ABSA91_14245 [Acidimicrobiales bacterium]
MTPDPDRKSAHHHNARQRRRAFCGPAGFTTPLEDSDAVRLGFPAPALDIVLPTFKKQSGPPFKEGGIR